MDIRNPIYTAEGLIDCEINHPIYGWIPFTADPNDVEEHGKQIHAVALAMGPMVPPTQAEMVPPTQAEQEALRQAAYVAEADPLYFKWQAGEATEADWLAKRQEIRDRYPYPA